MRNWKKALINFLLILLANALLAISFVFFVRPLHIVSGGMGGIGIILENLFHINSTTVIFILAWTLFAIGWVFLGTDFAVKTLISTFTYPVMVYLFGLIPNVPSLSSPLLGAIYAAVIGGIGVGLSFRIGGSTGGVDNLGMIGQKYFHIKVEQGIFFIDGTIIILGAFVVGLENSLLGILMAFIAMMVVDRVVLGGSETYLVFINTTKSEEVNQFILYQISRGSTLIPSIGGYTHLERSIIQTVVSKNQYYKLKDGVQKIDPLAFMIVTHAQDVFGMGFKNFTSGGK